MTGPRIKGQYVRITRNRSNSSDLRFRVASDILDDRCIMKISEEAIIVTRASLGYRGKVYKMHRMECGSYQTSCPEYLQEGIIYLSEDSDEDTLIFYLNELKEI